MNTTQEELEGTENKVNRLEENLQAEQERRIQYETESQQLQQELATTHQIELDKQKNIISRLEENFKAEQQSRILYEKKIEQLQHELTTIQAELNEQKKEVNHLQEKIKEKSDDRASTEQSDIQEVEENPTNSDKFPDQKNADDKPDAPSNSKTDKTEKTRGPRDIKGRRRESRNASEDSTNHQTEYNPKPELVCRKNGWYWEILLVVPEEQLPAEVQQNGVSLSGSNREYLLNDFSEDLTVMYEDRVERMQLYNDNSPLIFKLRTRWTGDGRKVRGISRGYFIIFASNEWERQGNPPVAPETCSDGRFSAHYFYSDDNSTTDDFEGHGLSLNQESFTLQGSSIYDDSEQGVLFISDSPDLEIAESETESISWIRIGTEGGGKWER